MTTNIINLSTNFNLIREKDNIIHEEFNDMCEMRLNKNYIQEVEPSAPKSVATCLLKDQNFWLYHSNTIENAEEEKANPGDKLWLILRHMARDKDHNFQPDLGYKLGVGDTVKFGRVRYKVIMMQNKNEGLQEHILTDRFQKIQHNQDIKRLGLDSSIKIKKRRSSIGSVRSVRMQMSPRSFGGGNVSPREFAASMASIPRYQSQCTQFDAHLDGSNRSMSQDYQDSSDMSSSDCTESEADRFDDDISERDDGDIEDLATVQQNDQGNHNTHVGIPNISDVDRNNDLTPIRGSMEQSFLLGRFNSVVPADQGLKPTYQSAQKGFLSGGQSDILNLAAAAENEDNARRPTQAIRDPTGGMGKTGTFFFGNPVSVGGLSNRNPTQPALLGNSQMVATQSNLDAPDNREARRRRKYKKNQKQKQKQKQRLRLQQQLAEKAKLAEGKVCRICLCEESENSDPLFSPCKCAGTMSHIHLECLRSWLNSKRSKKEGECVKTYCWKALECELCKVRFPGQVFPDGTVISDKLKLSQKQIRKMGKPIEILDFERPESDFIVLESVTLQNIRIVHVIDMKQRQFIRVGRGHDADIRVTDISVSRFHARINRSENGNFYVEDNKSKFGTLVQVRKPYMLEKNRMNYLQMGRTSLHIKITDTTKPDISKPSKCETIFCCKKPKKLNGEKEISTELYPKEWNLPEQEDEEALNTQVVEQTRDEDNIRDSPQNLDVREDPIGEEIKSEDIGPVEGSPSNIPELNLEGAPRIGIDPFSGENATVRAPIQEANVQQENPIRVVEEEEKKEDEQEKEPLIQIDDVDGGGNLEEEEKQDRRALLESSEPKGVMNIGDINTGCDNRESYKAAGLLESARLEQTQQLDLTNDPPEVKIGEGLQNSSMIDQSMNEPLIQNSPIKESQQEEESKQDFSLGITPIKEDLEENKIDKNGSLATLGANQTAIKREGHSPDNNN